MDTSPQTAGGSRPYIIYRPSPGAGFWSNVTCVLQGLDHADRGGLVPVVDMERHTTFYHDADGGRGTANAWEYFFEQPGGLSLAEALERDPLDNGGMAEGPLVFVKSVVPPREILTRARELVARYLRPKPEALAMVDAILPGAFHPRVLGVHARGADLRHGRAALHAVHSAPAMYLDQALQLDREHGFSHIFLATDEVESVELFRQHFGWRLLTNACHRTTAGNPLNANIGWLFESSRPHHRYLVGLEVLADALLLARCGHLVCGVSNIAHCAMYFADPRQQVHPVPPLWLCPDTRGKSLGRAYVAGHAPPTKAPTPLGLNAQIEVLQTLLEAAENSRAEARLARDRASAQAASAARKCEALRRKAEDERAQRVAVAGQLAAAKEGLAAKKAQLRAAKAVIEKLRGRVRALVNRWTRLGWNLMPWARPAWYRRPIDDCKMPPAKPKP